MEWSEKYEIGIEAVDRQHKRLLTQINEFVHFLNSNKGYEQMLPTIKFFVEYTQYHFETEEEIMIQIDYPEFGEHQHEHNLAKKKIREILLKIKHEEHFSPIELYYFLANWITEHIEKVDRKIKIFIDENGIELDFVAPDFCENRYIYEQISTRLETIIEKEHKHVIDKIETKLAIKELIEDFFSTAKITSEGQLKVVMNSINNDLVRKQLIDLETRDYIKDCIKSLIDINKMIRNSNSQKNFTRFLLEEEFININEYEI
ncbi:MAG: hemerythrin family protein, partial [Spirochaetales bacterium]|nr:hemerythrin family protein [Spirochaetales bacterium]